jgi:hypothetical protein
LGEGINKIAHEEWGGVVSVIFGFLFLGGVAFAFFFFSNYMLVNKGV